MILDYVLLIVFFFFFSSRRRHTRLQGDWSSDVCSSDLGAVVEDAIANDPQLGGAITGLRYAGIQGGEIDNSIDDDGVATLLTYRVQFRSEERRVGKECRSRWSPYH